MCVFANFFIPRSCSPAGKILRDKVEDPRYKLSKRDFVDSHLAEPDTPGDFDEEL
jgi:hypothetical protein